MCHYKNQEKSRGHNLGALKEFVQDILGPTDDITFFEYSKKSARAQGPAVVGIQIKSVDDFEPLLNRMKERQFFGDYLNIS